jgi:Arc/MetJ-type ribon-helix-helix transcriptional regulator
MITKNETLAALMYCFLTVRYNEWYDSTMSTAKITISIDEKLLKRVDRLVKSRQFPNRSQAIQDAIHEKVSRVDKTRLGRECSKLDVTVEQALADEGLSSEVGQWPEY